MPKRPPFPPTAPRIIEMLAFPSVQLLDVTGPVQVFASANDVVTQAGGPAPYVVNVVAQAGGNVTASAGVTLAAAPLPSVDRPLDTLMVAGGDGVHVAGADPLLVDWVSRRARHARRVASVCTGAFLLAAAGALDGKRAVTHWSVCAELARRFPALRVESDPIFVQDGSVWTSAGVTSGIDLALALIEQDLGRSVALAVARYLVVFLKRPGGQAQFSTALSLQVADDEFGALHRWINDHLAEEISLPVLAREAGMSERNFSRRYVEATGLTPLRAVERLRIEAGRRLLLDTRLSVKQVSQRCGFGSEETMRRSFLRWLNVTPQDYRARWGG
ncbi:MAG: DJ-1/PfpI family protein [Bradyrhizobium sp.]|uniref:GlxA family transcriptional regulator n=1 Tax=Bradyrhizobium sp. TaxID=376 RepID=UPI001D2336D5|nr:helix-turn-helix domain-containing protein [Bradyrhizobium sp.]MBV9562035.1 DJ-1/PfpI family protein [Bradyrhizobium sp.]